MFVRHYSLPRSLARTSPDLLSVHYGDLSLVTSRWDPFFVPSKLLKIPGFPKGD